MQVLCLHREYITRLLSKHERSITFNILVTQSVVGKAPYLIRLSDLIEGKTTEFAIMIFSVYLTLLQYTFRVETLATTPLIGFTFSIDINAKETGENKLG